MLLRILIHKIFTKSYLILFLVLSYLLFSNFLATISVNIIGGKYINYEKLLFESFYNIEIRNNYLQILLVSVISLFMIQKEKKGNAFIRNILDGLSFRQYFILLIIANILFSIIFFVLNYLFFFCTLLFKGQQNYYYVIFDYYHMIRFFISFLYFTIFSTTIGLLIDNILLAFLIIAALLFTDLMLFVAFYDWKYYVDFLPTRIIFSNDIYQMLLSIIFLITFLFIIFKSLKKSIKNI